MSSKGRALALLVLASLSSHAAAAEGSEKGVCADETCHQDADSEAAMLDMRLLQTRIDLSAAGQVPPHADGSADGVGAFHVNPRPLAQRTHVDRESAIKLSAGDADAGPTRAMSSAEEQECGQKMARLEELGNQDLTKGPDALFPSDMTSIADGGQCGDTAAGVQESCDKYDSWRTIMAIGGDDFKVIGPSGIQRSDVGQGELGTCYFLAALASIAEMAPDVLDAMFVERGLWEQGIFTTRWFVNGKERTIQVDGKIPASAAGPFFVKPSPTGEFWPVILEKTWAKIFGTFKSVEGGLWTEAVAAITRAPVSSLTHEGQGAASAAELWNALVDATDRKFPMGAGSIKGLYGLAAGHAYTVIRAFQSAEHGHVVECYNPWSSDHYKGSIPNTDETDGSFLMTLAEYQEAFFSTDFGQVRSGYLAHSQAVPAGDALSAVSLTATTSDVFTVSLTWPGARIIAPCQVPRPAVTLAVAKDGANTPPLTDFKKRGNSATIEVTAGPGTYTIVASASFPSATYIQQVFVSSYTNGSPSFATSAQSPKDAALSMLGPTDAGGPCAEVMVPGNGLYFRDDANLVGGVPTYASLDGQRFLYHSLAGGASHWRVYDTSDLASIQGGGTSGYLVDGKAEISKAAITCGCSDNGRGVTGWGDDIPCERTKAPNAKYSNVECSAEGSGGAAVRAQCPVTCYEARCSNLPATTTSAPGAPDPSCVDTCAAGGCVNDGTGLKGCSDVSWACGQYDFMDTLCCATCASLR